MMKNFSYLMPNKSSEKSNYSMISKHKYLKNLILSLLLLVGVYIIYILIFGYYFTGDVYRSSEKYIVKLSSQELISKVDYFKENYKEFQLITTNDEGNKIYFKDEYSPKYYHIYFYFSDLNLTIQCILKPFNEENSILALYAVSKGINFGSWKSINTEDLVKKENKKIKKKFESEILDNIGEWRKSYFWE